jgi:DNA polymerase-1
LKLNEIDGRNFNPARIQELFQRLEFRNLANQLPTVMQEKLTKSPAVESIRFSSKERVVIDSDSALAKFIPPKTSSVVVYSRSAGAHGQRPELFLLSFDLKQTLVFNLNKLDRTQFAKKIGPILADPSIKKIGYDLKASIKSALAMGIELSPVGHDALIAAFVLDSLRREQTLTELAESDLNYQGSSLEDLTTDELIDRATIITNVIWKLYQKQDKLLKEIPGFSDLVRLFEWPVIPVLARMEYIGIKLDVPYMNKFSEEIDDMVLDLEQQIYGYADREFNIASPQQLAEVLFNILGLDRTGIKKGKTGFSTASSELDKLRGSHPIIDLITQYREVTKLKNTYVDALPKLVDENDRLHTTFNLTIAQTGRLSSTDPNLQNIPVRTDLGRRIRTAFVADSGCVLVSADYSQFELRLAAVLAGDNGLTTTAAQIYGRQPEDVTKQMRRAAKAVNFGVLYGMSPHGLSVNTGMTYEQAQHFIDQYFELRKPLLEYLNKLKEEARINGYVADMFSRRRPMPDIKSSNYMVRGAAERAAMNMPIQGTEADLMKLAMIEADRQLKNKYPKSRMLLQIHDSILVESPQADAENVALLLKTIMEGVKKLPVKLDVDTYIGKNWGDI